MSMNIRQIYESLLAGKSITLEFPNQKTFESIYSQLRAIKSRYDASYVKVAGIDLSEGKVIRIDTGSKTLESHMVRKVKFWLGVRAEKAAANYTIISIDEAEDLEIGDAGT